LSCNPEISPRISSDPTNQKPPAGRFLQLYFSLEGWETLVSQKICVQIFVGAGGLKTRTRVFFKTPRF
jgi:hypothetical protein